MDNGGNLLRMVGIMAIGVAAAWIVQVLHFGGSSSLANLFWVLAAAVVAGGGTGLVVTSVTMGGAGVAA